MKNQSGCREIYSHVIVMYLMQIVLDRQPVHIHKHIISVLYNNWHMHINKIL